MSDGLDHWRKEIRALDSEIIERTARRMELALKIGQYKADHQLPVKDFRVEKEIIERTRIHALSLGLAPDFAEDLMTLVMGHSVKEQKKLHQSKRAEAIDPLKKALVIGGLGRMGLWFSQYFQSIGFQVSIFDLKTESVPETFLRHTDLESSLDAYEVILITTPLSATEKILEKLAANPPKSFIIETSSLKTPIMKGLYALSDAGSKVASIHPMFGPDTDLLIDKNILICTSDGLHSEEAASLYFHSTSADLVKVDIRNHDRDMLSTLGLSHFINLLFGVSLSEQSLAIDDAESRGGATFVDQLKNARALLTENYDLYFDIQAQNPFIHELYAELRGVFERLTQYILEKNKAGFLLELKKAADRLGISSESSGIPHS